VDVRLLPRVTGALTMALAFPSCPHRHARAKASKEQKRPRRARSAIIVPAVSASAVIRVTGCAQ
jgi:hypothetical protein